MIGERFLTVRELLPIGPFCGACRAESDAAGAHMVPNWLHHAPLDLSGVMPQLFGAPNVQRIGTSRGDLHQMWCMEASSVLRLSAMRNVA